jgi:hypothetical protein
MISKTDEEIRGKSFVYVIMNKILGEDKGEAAIQKVCFTKDKKGLVFDVLSEYDELIQKNWFNTKSLELKALTELPDIEQESFSSGGGGRGYGNGRGGGYGDRNGGGGFRRDGRGGSGRGGRGGGGRFGGRDSGGGFGRGNSNGFSNKRKFDEASSASSNKKIKFD